MSPELQALLAKIREKRETLARQGAIVRAAQTTLHANLAGYREGQRALEDLTQQAFDRFRDEHMPLPTPDFDHAAVSLLIRQ